MQPLTGQGRVAWRQPGRSRALLAPAAISRRRTRTVAPKEDDQDASVAAEGRAGSPASQDKVQITLRRRMKRGALPPPCNPSAPARGPAPALQLKAINDVMRAINSKHGTNAVQRLGEHQLTV